MFVRVPKTRTSLTPHNFKPICIGDNTPNRSNNASYYEPNEISQQSIQCTYRVEDQLKRQSASNLRNRIIADKENLVRVPGQSLSNQPSSKELQQVVCNLKKQKEDICNSLSETLKKNNFLQEQIDVQNQQYNKIANNDIEQQALNYQQNLDEFMHEFNELVNKIAQLEEQNNKLAEQNEHQKWYLQQIQCQSSRFNQTHNFGSG